MEKSKQFSLSKHDLKRGAEYAGVVFVGIFLSQVAQQEQLTTEVIGWIFETSIISFSGIIATKFFTDYTKG